MFNPPTRLKSSHRARGDRAPRKETASDEATTVGRVAVSSRGSSRPGSGELGCLQVSIGVYRCLPLRHLVGCYNPVASELDPVRSTPVDLDL